MSRSRTSRATRAQPRRVGPRPREAQHERGTAAADLLVEIVALDAAAEEDRVESRSLDETGEDLAAELLDGRPSARDDHGAAPRGLPRESALEPLHELGEKDDRRMLRDRRDLVAARQRVDDSACGPHERPHGVRRVVPLVHELAERVAATGTVARRQLLQKRLEPAARPS